MRSRVLSGNEPDKSQFSMVSCSQLKEGVTLRFPIYDARNILLLSAGATITQAAIQKLIQRGVHAVKVHYSELARLRGPTGGAQNAERKSVKDMREVAQRFKHLEAEEEGEQFGALRCNGSVLKTVTRHGKQAYDAQTRQKLKENSEQIVQQVEKLFDSIANIKADDLDTLEGISNNALGQMTGDIDLFVSLGMSSEGDNYPARHSQQTAMLAMAMGTNIGLDKRSLMELGIGCLSHDIGMLHIDRAAWEAKPVLDVLSFLEITKHPGITFDLMRDVDQLAGASRLVAFQMHERCDGSGYPRRRRIDQIHPLSRVAAVADVFTAMISPRPHRPAMMPYLAIEYLLRSAQQGLFDQLAVRGLLKSVSLFPIGSFVELSDGRVGRVMRTNGDSYTKPIIEAWNRGNLEAEAEVVDLLQETALEVARPIPSLNTPPLEEPASEPTPEAETPPPEATEPAAELAATT